MNNHEKAVKFLTFLQNGNVVVIKDAAEFRAFSGILRNHGLQDLLRKGGYQDWIADYSWKTNLKEGWDGKTLYAECQSGKEGIGIYPYTPRTQTYWYGQEPLTVNDIDCRSEGGY